MKNRNNNGQFTKGNSGNPSGRPKNQTFTKELSLNDLINTYPKLLKGEFFGRAIVNPNK